jgi:hypothetical protein
MTFLHQIRPVVLALAFGLAGAGLWALDGRAQAPDASTSQVGSNAGSNTVSRAYISAFVKGEKFKAFVMGDSLARQMLAGLTAAFAGRSDIELINLTRANTGFTRANLAELLEEAASLLALERVDIAVVSLGLYDIRPYRRGRKKIKFLSPEWRRIYTARVDRFMDRLSKQKVAIYWVGLPVVRSRKFDAGLRELNAIFKARAASRGVKFIDTIEGFTGAAGKFRAWGPDRNGRMRRLRAADGIHFSAFGRSQYADLTARRMIADINHTKAVRNIDLAGNAPLETRETTVFKSTPEQLTSIPGLVEPAPRPTLTYAGAEQPKTTRVLDKPALPGGLHAMMRLATGGRISGTAKPVANAKSDKEQQPPHIKVLLVGDALKPKPGRADDFAWPPEPNR